jgi:hypothetical protein
MSVRVWGGFYFDDTATPDEINNFVFDTVRIASENLIGVILGWNVPLDFRQDFKNDSNTLPFEIIDDPTTNVAEVTFTGDGVRVSVDQQRVDKGESLDSRMSRVQNFLRQLFEIRILKTIVLHVIGETGREISIDTTADNFKEKIIELFKQMKNWTPNIKFTLKKD